MSAGSLLDRAYKAAALGNGKLLYMITKKRVVRGELAMVKELLAESIKILEEVEQL